MQSKYPFSVRHQVHCKPFVGKLTRVSTTIVLLFIGMMFLPWEQTVQGSGKLIAFDPVQRDYKIKATYSGFVENYFVKENEFVRKGDPLCALVDQDAKYGERLIEKERLLTQQLKEVKSRYDNIISEQQELKAFYQNSIDLLDTSIRKSKEELKKLDFELSAAQKNYETKKLNLTRVTSLNKQGIVSKRDVEKAQNAYTQAKAHLSKTNVAIEIAKQNLQMVQKDRQRIDNERKLKLQQNLQALNQAQIAIENIKSQMLDAITNTQRYERRIVKADKDGVVMRIYHTDKNRLIQKGEPILHFVPNVTQRSILLRVSDFDMPLIKIGLPVRIKFFGWPALQVSGWPTITHGTFAGVVKSIEPMSHEQGAYYIHIFETPQEPWPPAHILRQGTQATAWIRLETVPIWYQIWRYINSMPPNMPKGQ